MIIGMSLQLVILMMRFEKINEKFKDIGTSYGKYTYRIIEEEYLGKETILF